jgi:2-keto-3-deoxy-L-fuconate dehydrogenase
MKRFEQRLALVTGASAGIGRALSTRLAQEGASLVLVDRDTDGLSSLQAELGDAVIIAQAGDVADEAMWEALAPALADVSFAAVNAGIGSASNIVETSLADWQRVLSVNLDGAFLTLRTAMRAMSASGKGGSIVLTASAIGLRPQQGTGAYGASKAAVINLARIAAREGAKSRIRVNAIAPGGVETAIWQSMPLFGTLVDKLGDVDAAYREMARTTPRGCYAKPDELAAHIAFLLSDEAANITGTTLVSDGGYSI